MAGPDDYAGSPWHGAGADDVDEAFAIPAFLFDPLGVLRRRKLFLVLGILAGLVATAVVVYRSKPTYLAEASVLVTQQQIPEEFVRSTVREDAISNMNAMVGTVLSRENLSRLIDQFGLYASAPPEVTKDDKISAVRAGIQVEPRNNWGAGRHQGSIIYAISYRSKDPAATADVANALAGMFMEASIERRGQLAKLTTDFLSRQLERDEAELRAQSQVVADFRRKHRGQLPDELDTNLRRLEMLSERDQALSNQIAAKQNRIVTLESMPQATARSENELLLDELQRELARQTAAHTDEHPNVIALRDRVARLNEIVEKEHSSQGGGSAVIAAERRDLALLQNQLVANQEEIDDLTARVDATPTIAEQLSVLTQKEMVLRERYLDSLRKVEQAQLAENLESAQQGAQVSILDRAHTPTTPERPRWVLAAAGLVASIGLGVALMILLEIVDPVIISVAQLDRIADSECLGSMPLHG